MPYSNNSSSQQYALDANSQTDTKLSRLLPSLPFLIVFKQRFLPLRGAETKELEHQACLSLAIVSRICSMFISKDAGSSGLRTGGGSGKYKCFVGICHVCWPVGIAVLTSGYRGSILGARRGIEGRCRVRLVEAVVR